MKSAWHKHLDTEDDKQRFRNAVEGSKPVLRRLVALLNEMEEDLSRSELSVKNYDAPNWAEKQAHVNGQKAQIRTIKFLVDLDQEDK